MGKGKGFIAKVGISCGLLFIGFGIAMLTGGFDGAFITRDGAQAVGAILLVGGTICALIGGLAASI